MAEPLAKEAPKEQKALAPIDMVRRELHLRRKQLEAVLPKHLTPDRLCRLALLACEKTPKLLECDRPSLFGAILTAAQLGLEPDGVLGQAYLIPFNRKVQFIPGYKGLITLARQSGEVQSIFAGAAREGDHFAYRFGLQEVLDHVPSMDAERHKKPITHFYMIARFKDGGHHFEVMTAAEVNAIRDNSPGYRSGGDTPWKTHYEEMGKKTVIRRGAKFLPMNVQKAAALIEAHEAGRHAHIENGDVIDVQARAILAEEKPAGTFLDRFEQEPAIETTAVVVEPVAEEKPAEEPAATEADYDEIELRAKKKGLSVAGIEKLCMDTCGKALGELTHADANAVITALAKKG